MIAVTGANGLLGSFIVRQLIESRVPFIAIKRKSSNTELLRDIEHQITWREADILDTQSLQEAFADVTGVIHAAALVSFNPRKRRMMEAVNIEGTRNVVNTCLALSISRLLHVSSVAALGRTKNQQIISEDNNWTDSPLNTQYAETKYKAELEIFRAQEEGLSTIIINPSVILARGEWNQSSAKLLNYIREERKFYTDGSFNYVDVRDVAELAVKLYFSQMEGERFIISAGTISLKEFFNQAATFFNTKPPHFKISKPVLRFIASLESVRSFLTGADPLITKETARIADTTIRFNNQKVINVLNYSFKPLADTLQWCAEFYGKQMELKN
jgi:nucleoside-diphosphate-sugar epimerase